jgi:hypothetical protein
MTNETTETHGALAAYQIPDARLATLQTKVSRLARRCAKLKMPALVLREVRKDARIKRLPRESGGPPRILELPCTWCELEGPSPKLSGYDFLARLEHTETGNLVSKTPAAGEVDLIAYRSAGPNCDHCKSKRKRADTFVLRAPDGTLKQIGRNCLADYLRSANVEVVVAILELTHELSISTDGEEADDYDGEGGGGGWRSILPVDRFLAAAVAAVRQKGWTSRGAASAYLEATGGQAAKQSTADFASFISGRAPTSARELEYWRSAQPTPGDVERAGVVLAWLLATTDASDYMYNLRTAAQQSSVTHRTVGLLASAVQAYAREIEKVEAARRAPATSTEYFGEIKKRYDLTGTVTFVREIAGWRDSVKTVVGIESPEGHRFTWFATGWKDYAPGDTLEFRGTVVKHEIFRDRKQTVLSRCEISKVSKKKDKELAS